MCVPDFIKSVKESPFGYDVQTQAGQFGSVRKSKNDPYNQPVQDFLAAQNPAPAAPAQAPQRRIIRYVGGGRNESAPTSSGAPATRTGGPRIVRERNR